MTSRGKDPVSRGATALPAADHVRVVLAKELAQIGDVALREKVLRTWVRAMEISGSTDLATDIPSLKKIVRHKGQQYGAGLEHVKAVIRFAVAIADAEEEAHGLTPDRDIVISGALLHDVGKLLEKAPAGRNPLTGPLVKHAFSGVQLAVLEDLPAEVLHIIAYHASEGHRINRTLECQVVHAADLLSVDALERRELGEATVAAYVYVPQERADDGVAVGGEARSSSREIVEACTALSARYAFCCDRDRTKVADLFTEDAVLDLVNRTMRGRAEISEGMKPRPGVVTLHFCANTVIDVEDENNARGTTHVLSLGHEGGTTGFPLAAPVTRAGGIYFDRFRRVDGVWLFSERRIERIFGGPRS